MSRKEFSELTGVAVSRLRKIECGEKINLEDMAKIVNALGSLNFLKPDEITIDLLGETRNEIGQFGGFSLNRDRFCRLMEILGRSKNLKEDLTKFLGS